VRRFDPDTVENGHSYSALGCFRVHYFSLLGTRLVMNDMSREF